MGEILGPGDVPKSQEPKEPKEPTMTVVNVRTGEKEEIPVSQVNLNYIDSDSELF